MFILIGADISKDRCKMSDEVRKTAQEVVKISFDLLYVDPHNWSKRPCQTCQAISQLTGIDFGCIRKAKE